MTPCRFTAATASGIASRMEVVSKVSATIFWDCILFFAIRGGKICASPTRTQFAYYNPKWHKPRQGGNYPEIQTGSTKADLEQTFGHTGESPGYCHRDQHLHPVITNVHQETRPHRAGHRPHYATNDPHNQHHQQRAPCVSILWHVH